MPLICAHKINTSRPLHSVPTGSNLFPQVYNGKERITRYHGKALLGAGLASKSNHMIECPISRDVPMMEAT